MNKIPLHYRHTDAARLLADRLVAHDHDQLSTTLSRITYIGAVSEQERLGTFAPKTQDGSGTLSGIDSHSVLKVFDILNSMGVALKPEHLVSYLTLREHDHALTQYDNAHCRDFLSDPVQTDILVMGFIPFDYDLMGVQSYAPGLQVSPKHTLDHAWMNAALTSKSKIVITFGGPKEVNGDHFTFPHHRKSPFKSITHVFEELAGPESESNRMTSNVAIHQDYLEALKNRYRDQHTRSAKDQHLSPHLANV